MKKLIFSTIATSACLAAAAQGTVNFVNLYPPGGLNAPVYLCDGVTKASGPAFAAQLLASPTPSNLMLVGTPVTFFSGGGAGYFNGGVVSIPTVPPGATAFVLVDVWDSTLGGITTGATDEQAKAYWLAGHPNVWMESCEFTVVTGGAGAPPSLPGTLTGLMGLQGCPLDPPCTCCGSFGGFTVQPQSQTLWAGTSVTFSVAASATPAPTYQWYFNGSEIPGAVSNYFTISQVRPSDAGNYWAILFNPHWGGRTSSSATLTVLPNPTITSAPQSRTAEVGAPAVFSVQFVGNPLPACQWFFDSSVPVPGGTNALLQLTSVQTAQAGAYTVVVSNSVGAVTSPPAMLSVIPPVPRQPVPALELAGQPGTILNIDSVDALGSSGDWQLLSSVSLTNPPQTYLDVSSPTRPQRFYRAWQAAGPTNVPALSMAIAPGIILNGSIGSSVRLDAINEAGPTDAWFTVATIQLTNSPEVYPDVSAIGQPPRLWRIVPLP